VLDADQSYFGGQWGAVHFLVHALKAVVALFKRHGAIADRHIGGQFPVGLVFWEQQREKVFCEKFFVRHPEHVHHFLVAVKHAGILRGGLIAKQAACKRGVVEYDLSAPVGIAYFCQLPPPAEYSITIE
jgi:hypothetical protein